MKKKSTVLTAVFLIVLSGILCSCGTKTSYSETATYAVPFTVAGIEQGTTAEEREALSEMSGNGVDFPVSYAAFVATKDRESIALYATGKTKEITVRDISACKRNVTYVSDDHSDGVVASKWVYMNAALAYLTNSVDPAQANGTLFEVGSYRRPFGMVPYANARRVYEDEYCMEKVVMDVYSVRAFDGKSLREMTAEEVAATDDATSETRIAQATAFLKDVYEEVTAAALARYGAFDPSKTKDVVGYMEIGGKLVRVVGYYETEADKLLSAGVSMDKNSAAYQAVQEQLKNTVVYSVCGNFLAE